MDINNLVNISGLSLDVVGAFIVFRNSPKVQYQIYIHRKEENERLQEKAVKENKRAKVGFLLILIGFVLQLTSYTPLFSWIN